MSRQLGLLQVPGHRVMVKQWQPPEHVLDEGLLKSPEMGPGEVALEGRLEVTHVCHRIQLGGEEFLCTVKAPGACPPHGLDTG